MNFMFYIYYFYWYFVLLLLVTDFVAKNVINWETNFTVIFQLCNYL